MVTRREFFGAAAALAVANPQSVRFVVYKDGLFLYSDGYSHGWMTPNVEPWRFALCEGFIREKVFNG